MKVEVIESIPTITVQENKNAIQLVESKSTITVQENSTVIEVNESSPTIVLQQTNNLVELGQQSINLIEVGIQGPQGIQGPAGPTGPGVSPGGSTTEIQYNDSGAFGGSSSLTWDEDIRTLAVSGKTISTYISDFTLRNAFVTFPTTANRNDANFVLGHTFIPVVSMSVTQLGRLYVAGNTQDHQIGVWEKATGTLVTSGTILAASSSDANNYKYVSVSAVTLDPAKEYVIGCQEFAAGDQWLTAWDSTNYFSPYVSRTGLAYKNGSTLGIPTIFSTGPSIYNTCTFKFTPNVVGQVSAAYDASNYISLISNSNGTGSIVTNNNDKTVAMFNNLGVGVGTVTSGFKAEITGGLRVTGSTPIRTVGTGGAAADTLNLGVNAATSINGIAVRGGYLLIEAGSGSGDVLINYDNPVRNVGIGGIFSNTKLGMLIDSASKKGLVIKMAASPTANSFEIQDSTGTSKTSIGADFSFTQQAISFSSRKAYITLNNSGGFNEIQLTQGLASGYGGVLELLAGDGGANYMRLEYNGGYPQLKTNRNNFTFLTGGGSLTFASTYIAERIGSDTYYQAQSDGSFANTFRNYSSAQVVLCVKSTASQTANTVEIRDSAGTALSFFRANAAWKPASMTDASAANDSVYYSTTASKLVYKDSGGTVNALY